MSRQSIEVSPGTEFIASEVVKVIKFDDIFVNYKDKGNKFALKIDSQGFEMEILMGSKNSIARVDVLILELSLSEVYIGGANYLELIALVDSWGFMLWDLHPGFRDTRNGQLLQFDGIFVRK